IAVRHSQRRGLAALDQLHRFDPLLRRDVVCRPHFVGRAELARPPFLIDRIVVGASAERIREHWGRQPYHACTHSSSSREYVLNQMASASGSLDGAARRTARQREDARASKQSTRGPVRRADCLTNTLAAKYA